MVELRRGVRNARAAQKSLAEEPAEADSWDDESDDERPAAKAGAKRKAARSSQVRDPGAAPSRKRQAAAANVDLRGLSLLEIVVHHPDAVGNAAKEWVARYKADRAEAAAELMTLLVQAAGADEELTCEDVEAGDADQLARRLTDLVKEEGAASPFQGRRCRVLTAAYRRLLDGLLRGAHEAELLWDDYELCDKLRGLVTALSLTVVRSFRHAATVTACQLVGSWIGIGASLGEARETAAFQLEAEQRKKKQSPEVIAALRRSVSRCASRAEDLRGFREALVAGVFSHRFRDVSGDIRALVIEAVGSWISELPSEFLANTFLKYVGWGLSDTDAAVRRAAVAAVTQLYANSDNVPRLADFAARFAGRFAELPWDNDEGAAVAGLRLQATLVAAGVVRHEDVPRVYNLLTEASPDIRRAAAELVMQLLEQQGKAAVAAAADTAKAAAAAAAAAAAGPAAGAAAGRAGGAKGRGGRARGGGGGADAAAAAGGGGGAAAAAAAAAEAILGSTERLQLAGLLAVMGEMAQPTGDAACAASAAQLRSSLPLSQSQQQGGAAAAVAAAGAGGDSSSLLVLPGQLVAAVVDALWEHMPAVLGDVGRLADELSDEGAAELRGRLGNAHLAALLAAAVARAVVGGGPCAGKKGRFGRPKADKTAAAAAAAADAAAGIASAPASAAAAAAAAGGGGGGLDEEAQQAASVALGEKLPLLLTRFQADPAAVAPLLALPRWLRLEHFLLRGQSEGYRGLLQQVDGLLQRHSQQELLVEAAATLVHAASHGPALLQEVGRQVLQAAGATSAAKLAAAAAAVGRLPPAQLAAGVADLAAAPGSAPDGLLSLEVALRRCHQLLAAGADGLARDRQLAKACQVLLQQGLEGRELGSHLTHLLLLVSNMCLLWQARSVLSDPAALQPYTQRRGPFIRALEALLAGGGAEQLLTPAQLVTCAGTLSLLAAAPLPAAGGSLEDERADGLTVELPAELDAEMAASMPSLQDLAFTLLTDLLWLEGAFAVAAAAGEEGEDGGAGGEAAAAASAAAAAAAARFVPSRGLLQRLWRHTCGVLEREAPEQEDDGGNDGEDDEEDDEEGGFGAMGGPDDLDGWDAQGAAKRRQARKAARRDALQKVAACLAVTQLKAVAALGRLVVFRVLPEPDRDWLLAQLITLMDTPQPAVSELVHGALKQLKAGGGTLTGPALAALTQLYEAADEEPGGADAAREHLAAVARHVAGLFPGHNLLQAPLRQLLSAGLGWVLESPGSRAGFAGACLAPLLAKLAPGEAEQAAHDWSGQLSAPEAAALLEVEVEAAGQLQAFLAAIQDRAAGKKPTRGLLKTPRAKPAAAAAAGSDDDDQDGGGTAAAAGGGAGGGGRRRGRSKIKFAADVPPSPEGSDAEGDEAAAGSRPSRRRPAAAAGTGARKRRAASAAAAAAADGDGSRRAKQPRRQQQQQSEDEATQDEQATPASSSDGGGWHAARRAGRSPAAAPAAAAAQPRQHQRRQQQQQQQELSEEQLEDAIESDDEEEQQQQSEPLGRAAAAGAVAPSPSPSPLSARKAALRQADQDLGPLNSQSQKINSQRKPARSPAAARAAAATAARSAAAAAAEEEEEEEEEEQAGLGADDGGDEEGQQQEEEEEDEGPGTLTLGIPSEEQLPRSGRKAGSSRRGRQQQAAEEEEEEEEADDDRGGAAGIDDALRASDDEDMPDADAAAADDDLYAASEEEQEQQHEEAGGQSDDEGMSDGGGSACSEPLASLQVEMSLLPDVEDGEEVDEPPPTRRNNRRRR